MPQNFLACDRDQVLLMAPSLRDWLPEDHFAWFVIDAVAGMDLSAFYAAYRQDGHGRAAFDPAMMVALLLYAYAKGQRSSRGCSPTPTASNRSICASFSADGGTVRLTA